MGTHLYSKRKCLLFFCTICQRTFVCLFYYCLYNSFLFIEHSSMSVKCLFFSYLKEQNLFCKFLKRTVFHVLGNREIQTNVDKQLLDKFIGIEKTKQTNNYMHILPHLFFEHNVLHKDLKCLCSLMVHVTCCFQFQMSVSDGSTEMHHILSHATSLHITFSLFHWSKV